MQRRKQQSRTDQGIIICCNHSRKFFIEMNGLLVGYLLLLSTRQSQIYVFISVTCLEIIQNQAVSLFAINYVWEKQHIDKEDIKSIHLNGLHRFCSLK